MKTQVKANIGARSSLIVASDRRYSIAHLSFFQLEAAARRPHGAYHEFLCMAKLLRSISMEPVFENFPIPLGIQERIHQGYSDLCPLSKASGIWHQHTTIHGHFPSLFRLSGCRWSRSSQSWLKRRLGIITDDPITKLDLSYSNRVKQVSATILTPQGTYGEGTDKMSDYEYLSEELRVSESPIKVQRGSEWAPRWSIIDRRKQKTAWNGVGGNGRGR